MLMAHSVVVIGGGVSGLAAARLLQATGHDVLVVEATGRLGGRIKQVNSGSLRSVAAIRRSGCTLEQVRARTAV